MSYSETGEEYTYFTDEEDLLIKAWLTEHGYEWSHNTVCGSCCGMYEDEYWVDGIGGKFTKKDQEEFRQYAAKTGIDCTVSASAITASPTS